MGGDDLKSVTHTEYKWPHSLRVVGRACEPPLPEHYADTPKVKGYPVCGCGRHPHEPQLKRYQSLTARHKELCAEYGDIIRGLADVCTEMLEQPCGDMDNKMASTYEIDYKRRGFPVVRYENLVADKDSPLPPPPRIPPLVERKPFAHSPALWPSVSVPGEASFDFTAQSVRTWFTDYPGRTEFEQRISAPGLAVMRGSQAYREPRPSSRRRRDDPFV